MRKILSTLVICFIALLLGACVKNVEDKNIPEQSKHLTAGTQSQLQRGKYLFNKQRYKEAMRDLLPLACDCIAEAEYAVGYMYYNGYGTPQDTELGTFWIRRAAQRGYKPAAEALRTIASNTYHYKASRQWPRGV